MATTVKTEPKPRTEQPTLSLTAPVRDAATLRRAIGTQFKMIQAMLPKHMTEERFAAIVISTAIKSPKIFLCTTESILNCLYQAAQLGLEINAATGEAYLIPYKTTAQLVPGYKGLVKLAIRSREVRAIEARLVYEGEEPTFGVFYGTDSRIEHVPNFEVERAPQRVYAGYAVAKMASGDATFEVMTRKQLDAIWHRSKSANDGPWQTDREEMYRKTVTRRLCKYLPLSPELAQAIELVDQAEGIAQESRGHRPKVASDLTDALRALPPGEANPSEAEPASSAAQTATSAAAGGDEDDDIRAQDRELFERESR